MVASYAFPLSTGELIHQSWESSYRRESSDGAFAGWYSPVLRASRLHSLELLSYFFLPYSALCVCLSILLSTLGLHEDLTLMGAHDGWGGMA